MMQVPAGCFMMGSTPDEIDALITQFDNDFVRAIFTAEGPQTKICFDTPFWIDKIEVTNAQFNQFKGQAKNQSHWTDDLRPRKQITWFEARDFCALRGARLPTESEWEYAARGPDGFTYPWGNDFDEKKAIWKRGSDQGTANVGSIPEGASWVGSLNLSGNVWEWTSSIYKPYPYVAIDGRESNDNANIDRVLRGGSVYPVENVE
jgi:iron(II)-dependent oxidoreductase